MSEYFAGKCYISIGEIRAEAIESIITQASPSLMVQLKSELERLKNGCKAMLKPYFTFQIRASVSQTNGISIALALILTYNVRTRRR